jgi:hypothetical protein
MGDAWGGYMTPEMEHDKAIRAKIPTSLTVTIDLKWAESMKKANLDINESTLVFEYPELYYLDLNLKYKCDPDAGSAKFDKSKKTLTIKLPVIGLTADSQAVLEANYKKQVLDKQEEMKGLQLQGEEKEGDDALDEENEAAAIKKLEEIAASQGMGGRSSKTIMNMNDQAKESDPYNLTQDTDEIKRKIQAEDSDDETENKGYLNVYDEQKNKIEAET